MEVFLSHCFHIDRKHHSCKNEMNIVSFYIFLGWRGITRVPCHVKKYMQMGNLFMFHLLEYKICRFPHSGPESHEWVVRFEHETPLSISPYHNSVCLLVLPVCQQIASHWHISNLWAQNIKILIIIKLSWLSYRYMYFKSDGLGNLNVDVYNKRFCIYQLIFLYF